jgi:nicotinate-nucleotide adenylyltransferase
MLIGLYFGSFNPVHLGHIQIARAMYYAAGFDELWFVVSPQNPLKAADELAPEQNRVEMLRLAIAKLDFAAKVCDIELALPKPSYTYKTLEELILQYPQHKFALVMGSDNLASIELWKRYEEIIQQFPIYFYPRQNDSSRVLAKRYGATLVEAELLDYSSTAIRMKVARGEDLAELVGEEVASYIAVNKLYR